MAITEDLLVRIRIENKNSNKVLKETSKNLDRVSTSLDKTQDGTKRLNSAFSKTGASIVVMNQTIEFAARAFRALSGAVSKPTRAFVEYEAALIGVSKTSDLVGKELQDLGSSISDLTRMLPQSQTELLGIAQAAGQLGVSGADNILKFTETVAQLGLASDISGEEAATSLARMINVSGESIDTVDKLASVIVRLGNNFAATESEIVRVANEVSRSTSVFGVSSTESAALAAAIRSLGISAEIGGSTVGRSFQAISAALRDGGFAAETLVEITRTNVEDFSRLFKEDAVDAFQVFISGLNRLTADQQAVALQNLGLSGQEVLKVLPPLAQNVDLVTKALKQQEDELKNTTALQEEVARQLESTESQFSRFSNTISRITTKIGAELNPAVQSMVGTLTVLVQSFENLIDQDGFFSALGAAINPITAFNKLFRDQSDAAEELAKKYDKIKDSIDNNPMFNQDEKLRQTAVNAKLLAKQFSATFGGTEKQALKAIGAFDDVTKATKKTISAVKELQSTASKPTELALTVGGPAVPSAGGAASGAAAAAEAAVSGQIILTLENRERIKALQEQSLAVERDILRTGLNRTELIAAQAREEIGNLDTLQAQLKSQNQLTDQARNAINQAKRLVDLRSDVNVADLNNKMIAAGALRLEKERLQIIGMQEIEAASSGKNTVKILEEKFQITRQLLELDKERLRQQGLLTEEVEKQINESIALQQKKLSIQIDQEQAPQNLIGPDQLQQITNVFGDGAMQFASAGGEMAGAMSGALGAAAGIFAAVLEAPKIVQGFADLINQIVDLPMALLEAFMNLDEAIRRVFNEFPQMIADAVTGIETLILNLILDLPDLFLNLIDGLVDGLMSIIDNFDQVILKLVKALISNAPLMAIKLVTGLVKGIPKLIKGLIKEAPQIGKAIVTGLLEGISAIGDAMLNLVTGGVSEGLGGAVEGITDLVTGVGDQVFSLLDFAAEARGLSIADKISNAIKSGTGFFARLWKKIIDGLVAVWQWIYDTIIKPIADIVVGAWKWVYEKVIEPIITIVQKAFQWVIDKVLAPMAKFVSEAFTWVIDNVITPIAGAVSAAFGWVVDNILTPMANIVSTAFGWVIENVFEPIFETFRSIFSSLGEFFKPVTDGIEGVFNRIKEVFEGVAGFFTGIIDAFKALFSGDIGEFAAKLGEAVGKILAPVANIFIDVFNGIIKLINGIAIPDIPIPLRVLGKNLGFTIPGIDLIPGNLNEIPRFAQGGFVPGSGNQDNVPSLLTPGEFVLNKNAASSLGRDFLTTLNSGKMPSQAMAGDVTINVNVDMTNQRVDESEIRNRIIPAITKELKNASLDGRFILSTNGLR